MASEADKLLDEHRCSVCGHVVFDPRYMPNKVCYDCVLDEGIPEGFEDTVEHYAYDVVWRHPNRTNRPKTGVGLLDTKTGRLRESAQISVSKPLQASAGDTLRDFFLYGLACHRA